MMMNAAALLSMLPLCRVQMLLFCPRILTRLVSAKCPCLHHCMHPIPPEISLPHQQAPRSIRRSMLVHLQKPICNSICSTLLHAALP